MDELVFLWKGAAHCELNFSDRMSYLLEMLVVASYVAFNAPFRKILPEESFIPGREHWHRKVEVS